MCFKRNSLYAWWWGKVIWLSKSIWFFYVCVCRLSNESMIWIWFDIFMWCILCLPVRVSFSRSSRTEPPDLVGIMRVTDDMIDSLVCPPPPSEPPAMSEEMINELIVPAPGWSKYCFVQPFNRIINVFHMFVVWKWNKKHTKFIWNESGRHCHFNMT